MRKLLIWSAINGLVAIGFALHLIGAVLLAVGPMFAIALLIETVSHWCVVALIPYVLLLPILSKPLMKLFHTAG